MPAKYVIVLEAQQRAVRRNTVRFRNDVQALVGARRIFVKELLVNAARPLCMCLGRARINGEIRWLNTWKASV